MSDKKIFSDCFHKEFDLGELLSSKIITHTLFQEKNLGLPYVYNNFFQLPFRGKNSIIFSIKNSSLKYNKHFISFI